MCQWGIWFLYNTTFGEVFLFFGEIRLFAFEPGDFLGTRVGPCWRWPPRKAFVLRLTTPTPTPFPRRAAAPVGADHPAKPQAFVSPRQQGPDFPRRRAPMLASASPQSLKPSSRHANRARIFRAGGRPCWRRPPREAFVLRLATPTGPEFSAPASAPVGADHPAKPLSFVSPRQQGPNFLRRRRPCWRWPPRKAFVLRLATPTGPVFFLRRVFPRHGFCRRSCTKYYAVFY